jgi:uncharacterized membrane protein HdeD (DUF308 family)
MKTEIIKPKKDNKEVKSLLTPTIYLILGIILAFKSNEAVTLLFYIIGILVIIYGIKSFITYYQNKEIAQYKNVNLSISIISILIGILIIILAPALEISIRYILGFVLVYMGISRLLLQISYNDYKNLSSLSNIVLIILGIYSILFSNAVLVIIGWLLIINAILLFWEYLKK